MPYGKMVVDGKVYPKAIYYRAFRGSGSGGQHRNTTESDIEASLSPEVARVLGIEPVQAKAGGRCQHGNIRTARKLLAARIYAAMKEAARPERFAAGDTRVRTYHEPDNRVVDRFGNRFSWKETVGKGDIEPLVTALRDSALASLDKP